MNDSIKIIHHINSSTKVTLTYIESGVCYAFDLTPTELKARSRSRRIIDGRAAFIVIAISVFRFSRTEAAKWVSSARSVTYNCEKIVDANMTTDDVYQKKYYAALDQIPTIEVVGLENKLI